MIKIIITHYDNSKDILYAKSFKIESFGAIEPDYTRLIFWDNNGLISYFDINITDDIEVEPGNN